MKVTKLPPLAAIKAVAASRRDMDENAPWFQLPSYERNEMEDPEYPSSACFLCGAPSGYLCANGCAEAEGWGI